VPGREPGIAGESLTVTRSLCVWGVGAQRVRAYLKRSHVAHRASRFRSWLAALVGRQRLAVCIDTVEPGSFRTTRLS
jgi:hypothetical protein